MEANMDAGFRDDFVWGGASASYQIEGAVAEDGRGLSVWDYFSHEQGRVVDGNTGDVAADHYHKYREDVDIMKGLGYKGYRFSIAWPRIVPEGTGKVNAKGLDFYDKLLDAVLAAGIEPYCTLFHWDYPYELYCRGGWLNNDSPEWYAAYVNVVTHRLGDRLKNYFTLNEPPCFIGLSYCQTEHAPGIKLPPQDTLRMWKNVCLGHGNAVDVIHETVKDSRVGYAPNSSAHYPLDPENPADVEAARKAYFDVPKEGWYWSPAVWSDPVVLGKYPAELENHFGKLFPKITGEDLARMSRPLDFYGQNIYNGAPVKSDGKGGFEFAKRDTGYPFTAAKWPVTPESLYWGPKFLCERYKLPLYITENGLSCTDVVSLDGKVHDPNRIDFLSRYLHCLKRAASEGVDIRGYFHWCVTDNFEWAKGYTDRFGMVFCNYETGERILKDSAYWYKDVIASNGRNL
jgi:beta-glucosidase